MTYERGDIVRFAQRAPWGIVLGHRSRCSAETIWIFFPGSNKILDYTPRFLARSTEIHLGVSDASLSEFDSD